MFSKSTMKDEDIKALINAVKKEFQQEIASLNDRIIGLEQQNLNLNTFIQNNFAYLDRKIDENHVYILNQWNPFMTSTIEGVKNDLIETMNSNKKDDDEISKKVDTLTVQVSSLNKMVVDEDYVNIAFKHGNNSSLNFIPIKKNIEVFDLFDKDIYFYDISMNYALGGGNSGTHQVNIHVKQLNLFPKLKKINLTKMLNTYFPMNQYCKDTYIKHVCFMLNGIVDKDWIHDLNLQPFKFYEEMFNNPNDTKILINKKIDILKAYIQTIFPHIEII